MRKRNKKLNLNQSTKSHDKLMAKNLFTSLMMYGKVVTTKPRASVLKAYALKKVSAYNKIMGSSWELKRWLTNELTTKKFAHKVAEKLAVLNKNFAVSTVMVQPRKGDNSQQYEVSVINFDAQKEDEK